MNRRHHVSRARIDRPVSSSEQSVLRAALTKVPVVASATALIDCLEKLRVVERCACGCDTVEFYRTNGPEKAEIVADGIGRTPQGGRVGVIVWGTANEVTGLEVYDMGAGDGGLRLPVPESVHGWDEESAELVEE